MSRFPFAPVVRAFIFNPEGKILLARHKKDMPWVLPGGHVEHDETLHDAMLRELAEEFGIKGKFFEIDSAEILTHKGKKLHHLPTPLSIYELQYQGDNGKDRSRTEYIFLMETEEDVRNVQASEITEYQWFDPEDILMMRPNIDTWDFYIQMLENIIGEDILTEE